MSSGFSLLSARAALIALFAAFAIANLAVTFARSGILYDLTGRVESVVVNSEKDPGIDDVWLVDIEGRGAVHLDTTVAAQLEEGDELVKHRFGREIGRLEGEDILLWPSEDFWSMIPTLVALGAAGLVLERQRRSRRKRAPEGALESEV